MRRDPLYSGTVSAPVSPIRKCTELHIVPPASKKGTKPFPTVSTLWWISSHICGRNTLTHLVGGKTHWAQPLVPCRTTGYGVPVSNSQHAETTSHWRTSQHAAALQESCYTSLIRPLQQPDQRSTQIKLITRTHGGHNTHTDNQQDEAQRAQTPHNQCFQRHNKSKAAHLLL